MEKQVVKIKLFNRETDNVCSIYGNTKNSVISLI